MLQRKRQPKLKGWLRQRNWLLRRKKRSARRGRFRPGVSKCKLKLKRRLRRLRGLQRLKGSKRLPGWQSRGDWKKKQLVEGLKPGGRHRLLGSKFKRRLDGMLSSKDLQRSRELQLRSREDKRSKKLRELLPSKKLRGLPPSKKLLFAWRKSNKSEMSRKRLLSAKWRLKDKSRFGERECSSRLKLKR